MPDSLPSVEFIELFTKSQLRLYRYVVTLVANKADAEDVLQNVNVIMLQKWRQFKPGTNYLAWAASIAYFEVMKYRTAKRRESPGLSEGTLATLAAEVLQNASALERRSVALPDCMKKLPPCDRSLITDHYFHGLSWESIAEALGRTSSSVRHSVCRIRRELKQCIDSAVNQEERP